MSPVTASIVAPKNALSTEEKQEVLDLLYSERFVDKTLTQLFTILLGQGEYYRLSRTMYRLLANQGESPERRSQHNDRDAVKPELIAVHPNEVWSWDITKLLWPTKWHYFYLYVILDIYSCCVVGWMIADNNPTKTNEINLENSENNAIRKLAKYQIPGILVLIRKEMAHEYTEKSMVLYFIYHVICRYRWNAVWL